MDDTILVSNQLPNCICNQSSTDLLVDVVYSRGSSSRSDTTHKIIQQNSSDKGVNMTLADILITVGLVALVGIAVTVMVLNKKRGKTSCGCDCSTCAKCNACNTKPKDEKPNQFGFFLFSTG